MDIASDDDADDDWSAVALFCGHCGIQEYLFSLHALIIYNTWKCVSVCVRVCLLLFYYPRL